MVVVGANVKKTACTNDHTVLSLACSNQHVIVDMYDRYSGCVSEWLRRCAVCV